MVVIAVVVGEKWGKKRNLDEKMTRRKESKTEKYNDHSDMAKRSRRKIQ